MVLTAQFYLAPWLRLSGAVPLRPLCGFRHVRDNFTLYLISNTCWGLPIFGTYIATFLIKQKVPIWISL